MISSILTWYFRARFDEIWKNAERANEIQNDTLLELLRMAQKTEYGITYGFKHIENYNQYAKNVPVVMYEDIKPLIERTMAGEQQLLWYSNINWFAKSSGTSGNTAKFIPISYESIENVHYKGSRDILSIYTGWFPDTKVLDGKSLLIGGSHKINNDNENAFFGDLSAVLMNHLPLWAVNKSTPDKNIALMENWEQKLDLLAQHTANIDVRSISGVPTWTLALIKKILANTGAACIEDVWPNLELFIHGGVSFSPYQNSFNQLIAKNTMRYLETYNASEGFFGIQAKPNSKDLLLITDAQVFYEFYPMGSDPSTAVPLWNARTGINYGVIITTSSGLWRYHLGDTIMFSSLNPPLFKITGRTKAYINTFGEELVIENAETALKNACILTKCSIVDFTAGPRPEHMENPGHEWCIEFEKPPENLSEFATVLDLELKKTNSDYEAKRVGDIVMHLPTIHSVKKQTFYHWLKQKNKLGGQNKIPRLSNNRQLLEEVLHIHHSLS